MDRIFKIGFLKWIGFLNDLFYGRHIAGPSEMSIPVLLDEKSTVVPVRWAGEQSGGKRKVSYGDARSNSERASPSACVGRRLSAPQIVWNRSTRRAGARGGRGSGANHKEGNSVTVARNRKQRTAMTMPAPYATRGVNGALFILEQRKAKAIQTIGIAKSHKAILSRVCRYLETW